MPKDNSCFECKFLDGLTYQCKLPLICRRGELFVKRPDANNDPKNDRHYALCAELHKLYRAKDDDYGSSFSKTRAKYHDSILIRLNDKLNRLETLYSGKAPNVTDEKIDDTLMDMAGYCILELVERGMEGK